MWLGQILFLVTPVIYEVSEYSLDLQWYKLVCHSKIDFSGSIYMTIWEFSLCGWKKITFSHHKFI